MHWILTPQIIVREMLRLLHERIKIPTKDTVAGFHKIGDQVIVPGGMPAMLAHRRHVSYEHHTQDLALSIDDYSDRYLRPCATAMALHIRHEAKHMGARAAVCMVPLKLPESATFKARANSRGVHVRMVKDYDIDNDQVVLRHDILYGITRLFE